MDYRCFFCFSRSFEKLIRNEKLNQKDADQFTTEMIKLCAEKGDEYITPQFAAAMHNRMKYFSGNPDPFLAIKRQSNELVLEMYDELRSKIHHAHNPFDVALRLAIAGNIIDFAIYDHYDLNATINQVLNNDFAIDHSKQLYDELQQAKNVLYLGDNNGEMVLDKLFIETIKHPNLTYAVRGEPIINDVTLSDAKSIGMDQLVPLISNGNNAPSTIVNECSEEFQKTFLQADLIISKGQGNLEGLLNRSKQNIFFLLMVKCEVIAESLGVKKGDFLVKKNNLRI